MTDEEITAWEQRTREAMAAFDLDEYRRREARAHTAGLAYQEFVRSEQAAYEARLAAYFEAHVKEPNARYGESANELNRLVEAYRPANEAYHAMKRRQEVHNGSDQNQDPLHASRV